MAIKAKGMATKIDAEAGTVTFSMLNPDGIAVAEHTMQIEMAIGVLSFVLEEMDDMVFVVPDEVVGHC